MKIAGVDVNFWPHAKTIISPAIKWMQDSNGIWNGSDRGVAQDIYEAELILHDKKDIINAVQNLIHSPTASFGVLLSDFSASGQDIFGPEVDYSVPLGATIRNFGGGRYPNFNKMGDLKIIIRGINLPMIGTSPTLGNLNLQENWEGDSEHSMNKDFSFTQEFFPVNHQERGTFVGEFEQTTETAREIISYLLTIARANVVPLPAFASMIKIFGGSTKMLYVEPPQDSSVVIRNLEVNRKFIDRWTIRFEINEVNLVLGF